MPHFAQKPKVLFFSTYVSHESGASYALRETVKRVESVGISPVVAIPESTDSLEMFPPQSRDTVYLKIQRPRRTLNPLTQSRYCLSFPSTFTALRKLILDRQIDIVHYNEITDFVAGMVARSCGVPSVCHVRTDCPPAPYRQALLWALRRTASAIAVPSLTTAAWIAGQDEELARRLRVVYDWPFDLGEYASAANGHDFRRERGISIGAILVVLVSKLIRSKGHLCFIRAAERVARRSRDVVFVIVGGPVPGHESEAAEIRGLAEALRIQPLVHFVGPRLDLPDIYAACDVAVHCPIYPDPYPTVVLLPMLKAKPVIGSSIGGIPEQIQQGETGIIVPPDDPDALAEAILRLANSPTERARLGSAAGRWIQQQAVPETQGTLIAEMYAAVLHGGDAKTPASSVTV